MILLNIQVDVHIKNHPEFLETLIGIGEEVRKLPGCIQYRMLQDVESHNLLSLNLEWINQESLRTYIQSRSFSITMGAIKTFGVAPEIRLGHIELLDYDNLVQDNY